METEGLLFRLLLLLVGVAGGVFFNGRYALPPIFFEDLAERKPELDPIEVVCLLVLLRCEY